MSHAVPIKTEFKSLSALQKAFETLGWKIKEKSKIHTYSGDRAGSVLYDYVAVNPKHGYDVGMNVHENGQIDIICDFYSPGKLTEMLGPQMSILKKKYVVAVTEEHYEQVEVEQTFTDGSFILIADDGY